MSPSDKGDGPRDVFEAQGRHSPAEGTRSPVGTMRILDETGDTMMTWSLEDAATLERAEAVFDTELSKGKLAFAVPRGGRDHDAERVSRFDASADEIVWVRPLTGG
jgi:hypothetical protein